MFAFANKNLFSVTLAANKKMLEQLWRVTLFNDNVRARGNSFFFVVTRIVVEQYTKRTKQATVQMVQNTIC